MDGRECGSAVFSDSRRTERIGFSEDWAESAPRCGCSQTLSERSPELGRNLIIERVQAGMRRAKLEGRHIGRRALELDEIAIRNQRTEELGFRGIALDHHI